MRLPVLLLVLLAVGTFSWADGAPLDETVRGLLRHAVQLDRLTRATPTPDVPEQRDNVEFYLDFATRVPWLMPSCARWADSDTPATAARFFALYQKFERGQNAEWHANMQRWLMLHGPWFHDELVTAAATARGADARALLERCAATRGEGRRRRSPRSIFLSTRSPAGTVAGRS